MRREDDFFMRPTVDFCFKELMQSPKVRRGFVAALMGVEPEEVRETTLAPTILEREFELDKEGILDVRVVMSDGTQLDLEMQVVYYEHWDKRVLYYLSRIYASQMKKGDNYDVLRRCIHVSILDFDRFPEDDICYRKIRLVDEATGKLYTDLLELQVLELGKVPEGPCGGDRVLMWMKFFSAKSRKEFEEMDKIDEYVKEAHEIMEKLNADEEKRMEYEARLRTLRDHISFLKDASERGYKEGHAEGHAAGYADGHAAGHAAGHAEGLAEGRAEGAALTKKAFRMERAGKSPEEIAAACGISVEKVRELLYE